MTAFDGPASFDELQHKLVPLWDLIGGANPAIGLQCENTVVVVPSISLTRQFDPSLQQPSEERMLFMLFLLRQPQLRLIYVTSTPVQPEIVEYYLGLVPGVVARHARKRLFMLSTADPSARPLSDKLIERPRLLELIRTLIPDLERAHLVPFNTTDRERDVALRLGIPMYATDPRYLKFGTKSGARQIFAELDVPHPLGVEHVVSTDAVVAALMHLRAARPTLTRAVVKLNEEVTGEGNAFVDLGGLPLHGHILEAEELADRVRAMTFAGQTVRYERYMATLAAHGGIVEELIAGQEFASPSVQLRITPRGQVEFLSTHDQMLGGPTGLMYLGARFPANPAYTPLIIAEALKVGQHLAREGVIGRFGIDFVVVRSGGGPWQAYAIEITLSKGGTTHPFLTLQYLTDGVSDPVTGAYRTAQGAPKCYVATDSLESPLYRHFTPDHLFDVVSNHALHFNHARQTGVVLHMFSGTRDLGCLGLTAIGDSPADAEAYYTRTIGLLDEEGLRASAESSAVVP